MFNRLLLFDFQNSYRNKIIENMSQLKLFFMDKYTNFRFSILKCQLKPKLIDFFA